MGYAGVSAYLSVLSGLDSVESIIPILIFISLVELVGWIYYKPHIATKQIDVVKRER